MRLMGKKNLFSTASKDKLDEESELNMVIVCAWFVTDPPLMPRLRFSSKTTTWKLIINSEASEGLGEIS